MPQKTGQRFRREKLSCFLFYNIKFQKLSAAAAATVVIVAALLVLAILALLLLTVLALILLGHGVLRFSAHRTALMVLRVRQKNRQPAAEICRVE